MTNVTELEQRKQEKVNRAEYARQVLENPVYIEAMTMIRASILDELGKINPRHVGKLQEATRSLQNLERLERVLKRFYESGKVEADRNKFGFKRKSL